MAQTTHEPRLEVTFGVGQVDPIPSDLPYTAPAWSASLQVLAARHLILEGAVAGWRHTTSRPFDVEFSDSTRTTSRYGTDEERQRKTSVSLNVLAAGTIKSVRLTSGVGVGRALFRTILSETVTACVSSNPAYCFTRPTDISRTWLFSMQAVLGIDVRVTSRLRASLNYRLSQPFATELGDASVLAGLAVGIR